MRGIPTAGESCVTERSGFSLLTDKAADAYVRNEFKLLLLSEGDLL